MLVIKMSTKTKPTIILLLCLVIINHNLSSLQANTISENQTLYGNSTIVSANGVFQLGFFKPGKPEKYYVGIWYQKDPQRNVVWVANRDNPVSYYAELRISRGNLVLYSESKSPVWSTNISPGASLVQAILLDDGNLIMTDNGRRHLWESFDHLAHTWLPGSKLVYDKIAKTSRPITSWKNSEDPSPGIFTLELGPDSSFSIMWNRSVEYWTSGAWNGTTFEFVPEMGLLSFYRLLYFSTEREDYVVYLILNSTTVTSRFVMDVSGQAKQMSWGNRVWNLFWASPRDPCKVYGLCGEFGTCNSNSFPVCTCLTGFEPKSVSDWVLSDFSAGCVRRTELCESTRFEEMRNVSLPNDQMVFEAESVKECESKCLNNCSCIAYAYKNDTRCLIWSESLFNFSRYEAENTDGNTLYIRLAASEFDSSKNESGKRRLYIIVFGTMSAALLLMFASYCAHHRKGRIVAKNQDHRVGLYDTEKQIINFLKSGQFRDDEKRSIEVPFVALESILAATDNFSEENKLGQGGFGPVYKGKFPGGQEIAIKRLSSGSGQGLEEFKNEVLLIAKLQHRNLVRLLGYCVEGDEKMLLYEYMPNKSLDSFVFDRTLCVMLSWEIRFDIIMGIARGLVYLHHDSRFRIIHRDLKASNVLLDEEMNPKISDFGLARIFGSKQTEANTNRVVGTYGYMSPEYALEGFFSIKSDVFSFGVVVLEIITGKRNTGFYNSEQAMSLLGYAWKLWRDDKALDIMDATLSESCATSELLRCVNVGLLCVQEDPSDRPTMPNVVFMLGNETACLPSPKQPAFVPRISTILGSSSTPSSENELTATTLQGR